MLASPFMYMAYSRTCLDYSDRFQMNYNLMVSARLALLLMLVLSVRFQMNEVDQHPTSSDPATMETNNQLQEKVD